MQFLPGKKYFNDRNNLLWGYYIFHWGPFTITIPSSYHSSTDEMLLAEKEIYSASWHIIPAPSGKDHATAFGCQTEPRFPYSHLRSWDLTLLQTQQKQLCSQQTFNDPLVWQREHNLKVPLQAVYRRLLSHKWSPDIFYPFFPFPLINIISCIKTTQNIWKDRVCSGSDGKMGEYRWESICRFLQFSTTALEKTTAMAVKLHMRIHCISQCPYLTFILQSNSFSFLVNAFYSLQ